MAASCWIIFTALIFFSVDAEMLSRTNDNQLEGLGYSRIIQELQLSRQKRDTNDGCCKKKGPVPQQQPIVVNHYHNYYYNCPCVPNQFTQPPPSQSPSPVCSPDSTCIDCTCGKSGAISCSVPQPASTYQQPSPARAASYQQPYQPSTQNRPQPADAHKKDLTEKDKNTAFSFSMLFDDPVAKDFYNFVTNNFVRREIPLEIAEIECSSAPLSVLDDPICKEFFNLFTQSFVRKGENTTSNPTFSKQSTQKPSLAPSTRRN